MKKLIMAIATFASISIAQADTLKFDAVHSYLGFSIGHLSVSEVRGSFKMTDGVIVKKGDDFTDAQITMTIDMNSVDTDNDKRDDHLRTADFFDVQKHPVANFKSTSCKKTGDQKYTLTGDFTMHGITKPVTLEMTVKAGINPNNNKPIFGLRVSGTIKRTDYGISASTPNEILTDEVAILANLEFGKE